MTLSLSDEDNYVFIKMQQPHPWIVDLSLEDYHNRTCNSYSSITHEMGNVLTGEYVYKLSTKYFYIWPRDQVTRSLAFQCLTHSVPRNEDLVPCGCAQAARGTRTSFRELYCCCLGKKQQTETGFKMNFRPMKAENSITSYCIILTFKSAEM